MRITTVVTAFLTTSALALGLGALPAHAESRTVADSTGDVRTFTQDYLNPTPATSENEPADPGDTSSTTSDGDIESVTYSHTGRRITISIQYVALKRGHDTTGWVYRLQGRNGQRRDVELSKFSGQRRIDVYMTRARNGRTVCKGNIERSVDFSASQVEVSFPRRCMAHPRAYRVAHVSYRATSATKSTQTYYYDDANRAGGSPTQAGNRFSPWIARG